MMIKFSVSCGECKISYATQAVEVASEDMAKKISDRIKCMLCQGPVLVMEESCEEEVVQEKTVSNPTINSKEIDAAVAILASTRPDIYSNTILIDWANVNQYFSPSQVALQSGSGWLCRRCDSVIGAVKQEDQEGGKGPLHGLPVMHSCKSCETTFTQAPLTKKA